MPNSMQYPYIFNYFTLIDSLYAFCYIIVNIYLSKIIFDSLRNKYDCLKFNKWNKINYKYNIQKREKLKISWMYLSI